MIGRTKEEKENIRWGRKKERGWETRGEEENEEEKKLPY